ncbi:hypothetical protein SSX86_014438 [Deinandra increscens subsp. villosa]|uniref:Uncharacterized protein n=1 Tax=Deinandra increscens subsp. villosa TaxID=3103831 RepID=A0AAP0D5Z5_9ASTR
MADEAQTSQILPPSVDQAAASVEGTINSTGLGGASSSCNNNNVVETSGLTSDGEGEKSLEYAEVLMERGSKANREEDYVEATDCFSRALEIRAAYYGELAPECVRSYYKYGCALLYKAQEESDPLVSASVSKKEVNAEHDSVKGAESGEASVSSKAKEGTSSFQGVPEDGGDEDQEEDDEASDGEEDESDLDLAWKMLDVARAIAEKQPGDTMEKVDILSALAEVALEREDVDTSLSDYLKALSMLERLAEPDSRHIAELNFRICLCLELGSKGEEAIPYCQKAISVCKSRLQRLTNEIEGSSGSMPSASAESAVLNRQSSCASQTTDSVADKEKEIDILTGLSSELEKKLEDLQQAVSNPSVILSDILGMIAAKGKTSQTSGADGGGLASSRIGMMANSSGFESPTVSTAHTNGDSGVTNLGVVGRGVKRVSVGSVEPPSKKPATAESGGSV